MQTVLIVIHLMVVTALVVVVLLQRSEGGALGMGGGSGFMTGRGQANVLTRATAILATLFFLTSLGLTLLWGHLGLSEPGKGALGLFQPMAVVAGWGVIAAFMVQLIRGTGRPLRLESTVATMGGVMIVVMTSGWAALAQWNTLPLAPLLLVTIGATVALVSLIGLTPWMQGRPGILAAVLIPLSVLIAVAATMALDMDPRKLVIAAAAALASSTLVALTAATAPSAKPRPEDRPVATTLRPRRAGFALAMAPVGAAGVIGHVILALMG